MSQLAFRLYDSADKINLMYCLSEKLALLSVTTQPGYELHKHRALRWWQRCSICNILTKASIVERDRELTSLFEIDECLRPFSFYLNGHYELHHRLDNGRLEYFNALLQLKK